MEIPELGLDIHSFNISNIDQDKLHKSINRELDGILDNVHNNPKDHRTDDEVKEDTLHGHVAERALIELYGFVNDPKKYMDVKYDGVTVDSKVTRQPVTEQHIAKIINKLYNRRQNKMDVADYVIFFHLTDKGKYIPKAFRKVERLPGNTYTPPSFEKVHKHGIPIKTTAATVYFGLINKHGHSEKSAARIMEKSYGYKVLY